MSERPAADRSEAAFGDYKLPLAPAQAVAEANRCLFCADAPCVNACPTRIDIPQFIRKIATGNLRGSARTIFEANVLGMSCARVCPVEVLCVGACVYNHMGTPPIAIGKLQRYATDVAYERRGDAGWRFFEAGPDSGKSVGLIGAGPASLAAAHELRRLGHRCTIYERRGVLGGLNTTGVAPYKMRADASADEVDWILSIGGIGVTTGVTVGVSPTLAELEAAHDAVFVGVGLGADSRLGVPGEDVAGVVGAGGVGVVGAVAWIERMKLGRVDLAGVRRCVVIGGGNTAVDAVREAMGLGVPEVTMAYRGGQGQMSGYAHEWEAAVAAGARALWHAAPVAIESVGEGQGEGEGEGQGESQGGARVSRVRFARTDGAKRPIAGSEFVVEADLVLVAIGQSTLGRAFAAMEGIRVERGRLVVGADGGTGRPGWFAGGDCANGGKEVVNAAAEGKAAARGIHAYFTGGVAGGVASGAARGGRDA